jgi:two-component system, NtrC family, response regulator HydG
MIITILPNRVALVAEDQFLGNSVQTTFKKNVDLSLPIRSFQSVRGCLGTDTDGICILAVGSVQDLEQAFLLVKEVSIQECPVKVVLVQGEVLTAESRLLTKGFAIPVQEFSWPGEVAALLSFVKEWAGKGPGFFDGNNESISEIISRRLLWNTPSLLPLVEGITVAATHDVTVLLTGETGTGKTFLARLMHDCSERRGHPFIVVPCGAQPAALLESAFFGHTKGAFTGADRNKIGKFEAAGKGTILLDEIDTLGLEQQAGLLRVIETGEYEPVGSNETHACEARIIVASNWDLQEAANIGRFRPDLYYRLNGMAFHLPPLRELIRDIAPLIRAFAAKFATKFRKELFSISSQAMAALETFHWPGNIRQLENAVQQAVLVSSGPELLLQHLPQPIREYMPVPSQEGTLRGEFLLQNREVAERSVIQRALANNENSGLKLPTLWELAGSLFTRK